MPIVRSPGAPKWRRQRSLLGCFIQRRRGGTSTQERQRDASGVTASDWWILLLACAAMQPEAMQLRYLQTLTVIAGDKSNTMVFPLDMMRSLGLASATNWTERYTPGICDCA
ncbi:MAG: hypothetical protein ABI612_18080 [Betaproteobacteria bacterium]